MEKVSKISKRKNEHLTICLEKKVESRINAGFENISVIHQPLPELDLNQIDTRITFLDKSLNAPLLISSMTGGSLEGARFNTILAEAAEFFQIAMGVGSQRAAIENPDLEDTFKVRKVAPNILLFANIGAVQLNYGYGVNEVQKAIDMIEADAIFLHLNPLQEVLQPEGNTHFSGLLSKIERICKSIKTPVFVKEVGCGIGAHTARLLFDAGVSGIDCAGLGGTSWALVEAERHLDSQMAALARKFGDWGIPTVSCLLDYRKHDLTKNIIASGGIRSGVDVFKSIALGAQLAGMALPFLRAANQGSKSLQVFIESIIQELKVTMFNAQTATIEDIDISTIQFEERSC